MASETAHGYASLNGGTDGGAGGTVVTVTNGYELQAAINRDNNKKGWVDEDSELARQLEGLSPDDPITIIIDGTITTANSPDDRIEIKDGGNVTLVGAGDGAEFDGIGLKIKDSEDVIVQNLEIHHVERGTGDGDAISIESSSNIWIDHNEFYAEDPASSGKEDYDGLVDIKRDSENITISNNYFHDNYRAIMINHSDSDISSTNITINDNVFDNVVSRTPLIRGGDAHVYNNVYTNIDHEDSTGINSRMGADVLVENNYFDTVSNPIVSVYSSETGSWEANGNVMNNVSWDIEAEDGEYVPSNDLEPDPSGSSYDLSIPYEYDLKAADGLQDTLAETVGTGMTTVDLTGSPAPAPATPAEPEPEPEPVAAPEPVDLSDPSSGREGSDAEGTSDADTFDITGKGDTTPVLDFNTSEGDVLDVSTLLGDEAIKIPSQYLRFTRDGNQTFLEVNTDGRGNDFEVVAEVQGDGTDQSINDLIEAGSILLAETGSGSGVGAPPSTIPSTDGETISGSSRSDILEGDNGNNRLVGEDGADTLHGYGGADVLEGGDGRDAMHGGDGADWLDGGADNDAMAAGEGADVLIGADGDDRVLGGSGDDELMGDAGNDVMAGGDGADTVSGGSGIDRVNGGTGDDLIDGGDGDDILAGGAGADTLSGNDGEDRILGGEGHDNLFGGEGEDRLYGGEGEDRLTGGEGGDLLTGGQGADTYAYESEDFGNDRIADFEDGIDLIEVSRDIADEFGDLEVSQNGDNTVIEVGGDTITLIGVDTGLIDDTDFNFV